MSSKREILYYKVVEKKDGNRAVFRVDHKGTSIFIVPDQGDEHVMHTAAGPVDQEILIVFGAQVLSTESPSQGYPSLD